MQTLLRSATSKDLCLQTIRTSAYHICGLCPYFHKEGLCRIRVGVISCYFELSWSFFPHPEAEATSDGLVINRVYKSTRELLQMYTLYVLYRERHRRRKWWGGGAGGQLPPPPPQPKKCGGEAKRIFDPSPPSPPKKKSSKGVNMVCIFNPKEHNNNKNLN